VIFCWYNFMMKLAYSINTFESKQHFVFSCTCYLQWYWFNNLTSLQCTLFHSISWGNKLYIIVCYQCEVLSQLFYWIIFPFLLFNVNKLTSLGSIWHFHQTDICPSIYWLKLRILKSAFCSKAVCNGNYRFKNKFVKWHIWGCNSSYYIDEIIKLIQMSWV
jgi:hypothetical protein